MPAIKRLAGRVAIVLLLSVQGLWAAGQDITLLIVPREDRVVRLGLDIGNRHPTILLSYEVLGNGGISVHGWSGTEWVNITPESFVEGTFFRNPPVSALIVHEQDQPVPPSLVPPEMWCSSVYGISTTQLRPLIHLAGRHYDFKYRDWKWFAENYRVPMDSINPEGLNIAWYQRQLSDNLSSGPVTGSSDLGYLEVLRTTRVDLEDAPEVWVPASEEESAETAEDAAAEELEAEAVESEAEAVEAEEEEESIQDNPLTNAVPAAVILAAEDADESVATAEEDELVEEETGE